MALIVAFTAATDLSAANGKEVYLFSYLFLQYQPIISAKIRVRSQLQTLERNKTCYFPS